MAKFRPERIGNLIREEISRLVSHEEIKDPRVSSFLSITRIKVAQDLTNAKVFISSIEGESKLQNGVNGLNSAAGFIQKHLGQKLRMRNIPKLVFVADSSIVEGFIINQKIDELTKESDDN
ncbi:30S ribosome-binding factor RbfA [Spirochaeta cellobiosiphila]|uniref:30S ribosome-binding factor RbfA n=1 Tax=Spirochaeta cellobiosiphila TaxID=504483 RepID=UPI0003FB414F|nr:30S ribosome-binding factor RbfA [Spirochaeta cellobiosiphila]